MFGSRKEKNSVASLFFVVAFNVWMEKIDDFSNISSIVGKKQKTKLLQSAFSDALFILGR